MMKLFRSLSPIHLVPILAVCLSGTLHAQQADADSLLLVAPLPGLLVTSGGTVVETAGQWQEVRRGEVLEAFRDHVYGSVPAGDISMEPEVTFYNALALGGSAIMKEVELRFGNGTATHAATLLVLLPNDRDGPVPLFLGLNFDGNHTVHPDPEIRLTESWVKNSSSVGTTANRAVETARGYDKGSWPVEMILSRGYGLATLYAGDIDPDYDDGFRNGIHALFPADSAPRDPETWGTIATWAWGLSRAMDYLATDPGVDGQRVAVIGHSRMGKTALWAGAVDERFALVISNNSGCGGAALSRRAYGERVEQINRVFPHWFADSFSQYNGNEGALPVDQHMLLALVAPRPLYVASAEEDDHADPLGEYLSLYYASGVYSLFGNPSLDGIRPPPVDRPLQRGKLGYHIRSGEHDLTRYDWEQYLDFADANLPPRQGGGFENPVYGEWIREHLAGERPRLVLTPGLEQLFREKLVEGDPVSVLDLALLKRRAESVTGLEPLQYRKQGRRLLGVSRDAIDRLVTLALVYRLEKDDRYLQKLEEELKAVAGFEDWNPSHFLDAAEMAAGVALALDWAGEWLSPAVVTLARKALVEKALKPGLADSEDNFWIDASHNWNLVCHGGLSLAALEVFEDEPELATRILYQAVEHIPIALQPYAPSGIYPEGPSYWTYATTYLTLAISAFESSLGTDFGFTSAPGVLESADFSMTLAGPSGQYFNYFDAGLGGFMDLTHFGLLSWFAARGGTGPDLEAYRNLMETELSGHPDRSAPRFLGVFILHMARIEPGDAGEVDYPLIWTGYGDEPIVILRGMEHAPDAFFLAAKGGRAADNHGNMDAGSFVFELDGVRWSVDPGNQDYYALEQVMGNQLWSSAQTSRRWTLLTKNNFGHSTLTVNGNMHRADARVRIIREERRKGEPEVTFDLTPVFGDDLKRAHRTFSRSSGGSLRIRDDLEISPSTETLTWQMMTLADVEVEPGRILLRQDGKSLILRVISDLPWTAKVVELSPPPLEIDRDIRNLRRIEIRVKGDAFNGNSGQLTMELGR